jgi:rubrerythrin
MPRLREAYPATASIFDAMAAEEDEHRRRLIELYRARYGDLILPIRREHVADLCARRPVWLVETLGLDRLRAEAPAMEREAEAFYCASATQTTDAEARRLGAQPLHGDALRARCARWSWAAAWCWPRPC